MPEIETDVLVIGAGMAGLTAAARAAISGRSVVVVEKSAAIGGSAQFAGYAWTAPSHDVMDEVNPDGDPALRRALVDGFSDGIDWIRSLGVDCTDAVTVLRYGTGHQFDTNRYIDECRRRIRSHGGELHTSAETLSLLTLDSGVVGARVRLSDGTECEIRWITGSYVEGAAAIDKFDLAQRRGGRCGIAESLDEFAYLPEEWGYDGAAIADQIRALNAAGPDAQPPRRYDSKPLDEGPYYLVEACPALTFPFHGIRIDEHGRVLDATGGTISGLFAAGSDTGGLYNRAYTGGIAPALVFGLAAADFTAPVSTC
ncbi:MAG: FAD-binding protein [Rhodococcus sp. (in: high G+C Gram-positive bacteria)]|nr:MAG: FAD-binding protein [Rhodococcus sp. (in: high G+C Gram-positive bacteria)]